MEGFSQNFTVIVRTAASCPFRKPTLFKYSPQLMWLQSGQVSQRVTLDVSYTKTKSDKQGLRGQMLVISAASYFLAADGK